MLQICVQHSDGRTYHVGEYKKRFTIQSVVKPILLLQALMDNGEEYVRARVGVEATGKPFDAINFSDQSLDSGNIQPHGQYGGYCHVQPDPWAQL